MNLITAHLTRLTEFSGRENRKPFWLWILTVYLVQTVVGTVLMVTIMASMMGPLQQLQEQDQTYLNQHPEVASRLMMNAMIPVMRSIFILSAVMGLLLVALIAAAVVRRLHDSDRSGWWALPSAVIQLLTLAGYAVMFPRFFAAMGSIDPNAGPEAANAAMASILPLFGLVWLLGLVGFGLMVMLIVFLAKRGTVGPNRYGADLLPPPVWAGPPGWDTRHDPAPQPYAPQSYPARPEPPTRPVGPWGDPPPPR